MTEIYFKFNICLLNQSMIFFLCVISYMRVAAGYIQTKWTLRLHRQSATNFLAVVKNVWRIRRREPLNEYKYSKYLLLILWPYFGATFQQYNLLNLTVILLNFKMNVKEHTVCITLWSK